MVIDVGYFASERVGWILSLRQQHASARQAAMVRGSESRTMARWLWKKHAKIRVRYAPEHTREQLRKRYGLYRMPHHAAYEKL
jgi:hypothetical protein